MLSVEKEPQIHHTSELLSKQTYCVYYCIVSLSVLLMLWHLGPFILERDCLSWCYFTIETANSFLTEEYGLFIYKWINTSIFPAYPSLSLTINSGLSHTRARSLSTRQPQCLESTEFTHPTVPCFSCWKDDRACSHVFFLYFLTKLDFLCDTCVQRQFLLISTIFYMN